LKSDEDDEEDDDDDDADDDDGCGNRGDGGEFDNCGEGNDEDVVVVVVVVVVLLDDEAGDLPLDFDDTGAVPFFEKERNEGFLKEFTEGDDFDDKAELAEAEDSVCGECEADAREGAPLEARS
jgi:hypothetical protein